jgi:hypothetical protein
MIMDENERNIAEARNRAEDAWQNRYKHGKAGRAWAAVAQEQPQRREISEILARLMYAYEAADAEAEREFRALAARLEQAGGDTPAPAPAATT